MNGFPAPEDSRLSVEFLRRLAGYFSPHDPTSPLAPRCRDWYADHTGRRSEWFRTVLIPRLLQARPLAGRVVLDFACGMGSSTVVLAENGARVVGAETETIDINVAAQRAGDLGVAHRCAFVRIPYLVARDDRLPFRDAAFDLCTLIGVLEHMKTPERRRCAAEIHRVVKPGGELFIFDTPNRMFPKDMHTTQLAFVGWLPESVARKYAVWRKRFDRNLDFRRYGANGVSRREIDRLFPSARWEVTSDKTTAEVVNEFRTVISDPDHVSPFLAGSRHALGGRTSYWTESHAIGYRKRL